MGTTSWAGSVLPMTTALANLLRGILEPVLADAPRTWPFNDRVLAWLLPNLKDDVATFHLSHGPAMNRVFEEFQLQTIDRSLVRRLAARAENLAPGMILELRRHLETISKRGIE
jgi:hypothetical protein